MPGRNSNFLSSAFQLSITKKTFEIASFLVEFVCLFVDSQTMPFVLHPLRHMETPEPRKNHVPFSPTKKRTAQYMRREGKSLADIAAELNVSISSVSRNLRNLGRSQDFYASTRRSGRPHVLTADELQKIRQGIESGDYPDASAAHRALVPHVDVTTVRRALREMGLYGRRRRAVPVLTAEHAYQRLNWALKQQHWWRAKRQSVVCSDECRVEMEGNNGPQYCRRPKNTAFLPEHAKPKTAYGGGGIMISGFITCNGVGRLHRVDGKVNAHAYTSILDECLLPTISDAGLDPNAVIFQQDGARSHTAKWTQNWLASHNINTMPWPPHSPDMNIIEHVWATLKHRVKMRNPRPKNLDELWEMVEWEWYHISDEEIAHLYNSIPHRIAAVIKADGWYTEY